MNLDGKALHTALEKKRKDFNLGWMEIAYYNEIGLETLEGLAQGVCPCEEVFHRLCVWVGIHKEDFLVKPETAAEMPKIIARKRLVKNILHSRKKKLP